MDLSAILINYETKYGVKMANKLLTSVLFLFLSLSLTNANAFTSYGVRGCGKFVSSVESTSEKDKYAKNLNEMAIQNWISGYVTAYNSWLSAVTKKNDADAIATTDIDGVYMSVLNYCKENPLKNVSDAMAYTLDQLDSQQQPKRKR